MFTLQLLFMFYFMSVSIIAGYLFGMFIWLVSQDTILSATLGTVFGLFLAVPLAMAVL